MKSKFAGSALVASLVTLAFAGCADTARAATLDDPVSQYQYKAFKDWAEKAIQSIYKREKKLETDEAAAHKSGQGNATEEAIDLTSPPPSIADGSKTKGPSFETYFDLNLVNQPGTYDALAFDNYHSLVFFDLFPTPDLTFSFNLLGPTVYPIYYELDYQAIPKLTLRAGKIWIPFDDLSQQSPHNIFGGRVGLQQLMPTTTGNGGNLLLPSLWTELGVGARYIAIDTPKLQLETDITITNGFTNGGTDPKTGGEGPDFSEYTPPPNSQGAGSSGSHRNKSIDLRTHALVMNRFGLGISYYTGQWNPDNDPLDGGGHLFLNMIGVDGQVFLSKGIELRAGIADMNVEYAEGTASRGGTYFEVGMPFLQRWKGLVRAGTMQLDSRLTLPTDITVFGATLLYNPGSVQFSLEHSRNLSNPDGNVPVGFESYTDIRMIVLL